jgi:hypothetical protein
MKPAPLQVAFSNYNDVVKIFISLIFNLFCRKLLLFLFLPFTLAICIILCAKYDQMLHAPSNAQLCLFLCNVAAERWTSWAVVLPKGSAERQGRCGASSMLHSQDRVATFSSCQSTHMYDCRQSKAVDIAQAISRGPVMAHSQSRCGTRAGPATTAPAHLQPAVQRHRATLLQPAAR